MIFLWFTMLFQWFGRNKKKEKKRQNRLYCSKPPSKTASRVICPVLDSSGVKHPVSQVWGDVIQPRTWGYLDFFFLRTFDFWRSTRKCFATLSRYKYGPTCRSKEHFAVVQRIPLGSGRPPRGRVADVCLSESPAGGWFHPRKMLLHQCYWQMGPRYGWGSAVILLLWADVEACGGVETCLWQSCKATRWVADTRLTCQWLRDPRHSGPRTSSTRWAPEQEWQQCTCTY
jgi:hypothetical protein